MEYIILREKANDYFLKYIDNKKIKNIYNSKRDKFIWKYIFKISYKYDLILLNIFFDDWVCNLKTVDSIIIFDNLYNKQISKHIKSKYKNKKIIFYYWNKINKLNKKFLEDKYIDEYYTFNKEDSENYNIKFNPQFYSKNISLTNTGDSNYDVAFLGMAKERKNYIQNIKLLLSKMNLKLDFKIIENIKDFVKYEDYLKMIERSKAILDIGNSIDSGLTVRALEAIFLKKKLITNYVNIKDYMFYNKNNIFILGEDDIKDINNFLNSKYENIVNENIEYFDFDHWIRRFI